MSSATNIKRRGRKPTDPLTKDTIKRLGEQWYKLNAEEKKQAMMETVENRGLAKAIGVTVADIKTPDYPTTSPLEEKSSDNLYEIARRAAATNSGKKWHSYTKGQRDKKIEKELKNLKDSSAIKKLDFEDSDDDEDYVDSFLKEIGADKDESKMKDLEEELRKIQVKIPPEVKLEQDLEKLTKPKIINDQRLFLNDLSLVLTHYLKPKKKPLKYKVTWVKPKKTSNII